MTDEQINEEFLKAIQERGIYRKLGVGRDTVSHWKGGRDAGLATKINVLRQLGIISIVKNG